MTRSGPTPRLSTVAVLLVVAACSTTVAPKEAVDLAFEDSGRSFVVAEGDVYEVVDDGSWRFVQSFYEPDFRLQNYVVRDGTLYQVDPDSGYEYQVVRHFEDGFESAASVDALIAADRWHSYTTDPARAGEAHNYHDIGNRIEVETAVVHSGDASLRFAAEPEAGVVSKASLNRGLLFFEQGDDVYFSGWFLVDDRPTNGDGGAFTIVDLESTFMQRAGIRLIFRANDSLALELKTPKTQFQQGPGDEVPFPVGQWVHVEFHVHLSVHSGSVAIWQDGVLVLRANGQTIPVEDTVYDHLEVGISALAPEATESKILYVDDIVISDSPILP